MNILPKKASLIDGGKKAQASQIKEAKPKQVDSSQLVDFFYSRGDAKAQVRKDGQVFNITEVIQDVNHVMIQCEKKASPMKSSAVAELLRDMQGLEVMVYFAETNVMVPALDLTRNYIEAVIKEESECDKEKHEASTPRRPVYNPPELGIGFNPASKTVSGDPLLNFPTKDYEMIYLVAEKKGPYVILSVTHITKDDADSETTLKLTGNEDWVENGLNLALEHISKTYKTSVKDSEVQKFLKTIRPKSKTRSASSIEADDMVTVSRVDVISEFSPNDEGFGGADTLYAESKDGNTVYLTHDRKTEEIQIGVLDEDYNPEELTTIEDVGEIFNRYDSIDKWFKAKAPNGTKYSKKSMEQFEKTLNKHYFGASKTEASTTVDSECDKDKHATEAKVTTAKPTLRVSGSAEVDKQTHKIKKLDVTTQYINKGIPDLILNFEFYGSNPTVMVSLSTGKIDLLSGDVKEFTNQMEEVETEAVAMYDAFSTIKDKSYEGKSAEEIREDITAAMRIKGKIGIKASISEDLTASDEPVEALVDYTAKDKRLQQVEKWFKGNRLEVTITESTSLYGITIEPAEGFGSLTQKTVKGVEAYLNKTFPEAEVDLEEENEEFISFSIILPEGVTSSEEPAIEAEADNVVLEVTATDHDLVLNALKKSGVEAYTFKKIGTVAVDATKTHSKKQMATLTNFILREKGLGQYQA